ncbi:MAG: IS110 family transposase [Gammaproteobacteria bacterium]|nr:IS110 family transposase [Gammaproteobacteria bacterium]
MKLYGGIDLHSNNHVIVLIDEHDQVVYQKRLPNSLDTTLSALKPFQKGIVSLAVESTYNWYWLVDGLMDHQYPVQLVNTLAVKQYDGLKHQNDHTDAFHLAHLMRLGILPCGYIYPKADRGLRDLLRKRMQLVQQRTLNLLSLKSNLTRQLALTVKAHTIKQWMSQGLPQWNLDPTIVFALQSNLSVMKTVDQYIEAIEHKVKLALKSSSSLTLLQSVNGIGDVLGMMILLETGDIARFDKVGRFASYCRCVNATRESNGKSKGQGNRKNGNKFLAWAFVQAAHSCVRYCPEAKRYYQKKKRKTNTPVATKAVAHKLARACFYILRDKTTFDPSRCFA